MRAPTLAQSPPARELAAGLATAAVVAQILFAPAVLGFAAALIAIGRVERWRPHWLLVPAGLGFGWLLARGTLQSGWLLVRGALLARGMPLASGPPQWHTLLDELPLGLLLGSAEAALVLWLTWWRRRPVWRPGLVALLHRRLSGRSLRRGYTPDGFALGLVRPTGKLVAVSWTHAERGVLLSDGLQHCGLAAINAALQLRKTVLILDLADQVSQLGLPVIDQPTPAELGRAIRDRGVVLASGGTAELAGVLDSLREHGLRADCLAWITGAEQLTPACLDMLLDLGPATGTALIFSTTSDAWAVTAASRFQVVAGRAGHPDASGAGEFTIVTSPASNRPVLLPDCQLVER
jgi:hypothetical protein